MKGSMMNTLKRILALGITGTLLVLTACTKLDENPTNGATDPAAVVFSGYGMDLSQVLGKYDLAGIQGYVNFATTNDDKYSTINGDTATIINGIANSSSAKFIDGTGRLLSATSVVVNAIQLFRYADSYYQVSTDKPIDIYLGNGVNKYVVEAGADIPEIKGSVSFTSPAVITNITRGMIHDKDSSLRITWTGAEPGTWVEVKLKSQYIGATPPGFYADTTNVVLYKAMYENTGSVVLPATYQGVYRGKKLRPGIMEVSITKVEPKFQVLPNSKKIALLGLSQSNKSIVVR